ncbi:hypothetical protein CEW88_13205 [Alloyangia pacifica]|uniref:SoxA A3 domain-containing protein n=1 Tax=Alloyangia pacifica TaxID=311180 RepID=A0A2U8HG11_9RHOB|nr:hypothetical protein CEW88_13205 [Alloyangia pacifica]
MGRGPAIVSGGVGGTGAPEGFCKDSALAQKENMRPVEPLRRWAILGMAADQNKTAKVTALAVMADLTGKAIPETGTTIFRPRPSASEFTLLGMRSAAQSLWPALETGACRRAA